ncbi:MAG: exodeoxyribonuclease VII large subunit [Candidatus Omnitrophota bacterium]|nr:MAG: exodeoxyribonuclease VII large subunit [Candidatus Omnitrophota bacterium]
MECIGEQIGGFINMMQPEFFQEKHIYKVFELNRNVRLILENEFAQVWVQGEISNLRIPGSGHMYFSLKDENAQIKCVFFRGANAKLKFKLENGLSCILFGRIGVYERDGQYQLYVEKVELKGKGALQLAFEQLKNKLKKQGFFDLKRKRKIPFLPQRIGVVTSATGAAIRDILNVINRRYANVEVVVRSALVQGKSAAADIAQAIADLNEYKNLDVIIVGRGGGSIEDLWPFNEEPVAYAVYNSKIPVISAVGHEIDFTICDFTADLRAPTPSAAAELVVREKAQLVIKIDNLRQRLTETIFQKFKMAQMRFLRIKQSYALRKPYLIVEQYQQQMDNLEKSLKSNLCHLIKIKQEQFKNILKSDVFRRPKMIFTRNQEKIEKIEKSLSADFLHLLRIKQENFKIISSRLTALNPLSILARGYSITYSAEQKALKNIGEIKNGDILNTKLDKGVIYSTVIDLQF